MTVILALIAISLMVAIVFLGLFIWSLRSGQYDDMYAPSVRILFDDRKPDGAGSIPQHEINQENG